MKLRILIITLLQVAAAWGSSALAVPVLNENQSGVQGAMIYPDSTDANAYYYVPQYVGLCIDSQGHPIFSYTQVKTDGFFSRKHGLMLATLCLKTNSAVMKAAMQSVLTKNPKAIFAGMPFTKSRIDFSDDVFSKLSDANSCTNTAGVIGQEEACSILFRPDAKATFVSSLRSGLAIVMHFDYQVEGVIRLSDGLHPQEGNFAVAARISKSDFGGQIESYLH